MHKLNNQHAGAIVEERLSLQQRSQLLRGSCSFEAIDKRKNISASQDATHDKGFVPPIEPLSSCILTFSESR